MSDNNNDAKNVDKENKSNDFELITGSIPIADLVDRYPEVVEFLVNEYDFFCVSCMMSEFETLEEGAINHGIIGEDFVELLRKVNKILIGGKRSITSSSQ